MLYFALIPPTYRKWPVALVSAPNIQKNDPSCVTPRIRVGHIARLFFFWKKRFSSLLTTSSINRFAAIPMLWWNLRFAHRSYIRRFFGCCQGEGKGRGCFTEIWGCFIANVLVVGKCRRMALCVALNIRIAMCRYYKKVPLPPSIGRAHCYE